MTDNGHRKLSKTDKDSSWCRALSAFRRVAETAATLAARYWGTGTGPTWLVCFMTTEKVTAILNSIEKLSRWGYVSTGLAWKKRGCCMPRSGPPFAGRAGVTDSAVIKAVAYHTTGRAQMSLLEKILYLADIIEPGREFDGVEKLREIAHADLERAL